MLGAFATAAGAQSLAELAKKEQERRKATSGHQGLTNKDLPARNAGAAADAAGAAAAGDAAAADAGGRRKRRGPTGK